jgi:hypothetical protein
MNKPNKSKANYQVEDFHIVDATTGRPKKWYIREIMDVTSSEFERSELTHEKRVEIVDALGLPCLENVLAQCFQEFHPSYSAADEVKLFVQVVGLHTQGKPTLSDEEYFQLTMEARLRKAQAS